jgi:hypothetical protein
MTYDSYKAWIDAMPIDDVRRRIERLERKLSDLHMLERLYADRSGEGAAESPPEPQEATAEHGAPEGGGWTHSEGAPEHG